MADTEAPPAAAPAQKAQKKTAKKPKKAKAPANHPIYKDMVSAAITSLKDRKGSSRQAILKYIMANFKGVGEEKQANVHLKLALKRMADTGYLTHVKGKGAAGSFRVSKAAPAKKATPKKPKAKKVSAAKKKPAAKKAAKKPVKKAAKKAAKKPKKPAAKPAAKKPAVKKPAAKKTAKKSKKATKKSKAKK